MDNLTKEQAREVVSAYDYFYGEADFIAKLHGKFHLTEDELHSIFQILDNAFIKWS